MKTERDKGYVERWSPHASTRLLIADINSVIDEYADHLPITQRQVYYRLVAQYGYSKGKQFESQLYEALAKARRLHEDHPQHIDWRAFRDGRAQQHTFATWQSSTEWWGGILPRAHAFRLDPLADQDVNVGIWSEAAGMIPQLARVASPYGITVASSSGFVGHTLIREAAESIAADGRPFVLLHVGDLDPSGEWIYSAFVKDIQAFVEEAGGEFAFRRVALTLEQALDHGLPSEPITAKERAESSHARNSRLDGKTQAEALPPDLLAQIVRDGIEAEIDVPTWRATVAWSDQERDALVAEVTEVMSRRDGEDDES